MSKFTKLTTKIDDFLLEQITRIVKLWVKRHKFREHKFDFALAVQGWEAGYWVCLVLFLAWKLVKHHLGSSSWILIVAILAISFLEYAGFEIFRGLKDQYDPIWERRKNPIVYNAMKEICYTTFELHRKRRSASLALHLGLGILVALVNPLILPIYLFGLVQMYVRYVFDFDDPDPKKRKERARMTDLVAARWRELMGKVAPAPAQN